MNYVAFFAVLLPFQVCVIVTALFLVRRKTMPDQPKSWLQLLGKVLLLTLVVDLVGIIPVIGIAAVIIWLVALKRLSGLDVLGTALFSCSLGVVCFVAMMFLAKYFQVPLTGQ